MSYVHDGRKPIVFKSDPVDPDIVKDEVFFVLDNWLRPHLLEVLDPQSLSAFATGTTIIDQPRLIGPMEDDAGTEYQHVYAISYGPIDTGMTEVSITFRKSTETTAVIGLGREAHDHTVRIPVRQL